MTGDNWNEEVTISDVTLNLPGKRVAALESDTVEPHVEIRFCKTIVQPLCCTAVFPRVADEDRAWCHIFGLVVSRWAGCGAALRHPSIVQLADEFRCATRTVDPRLVAEVFQKRDELFVALVYENAIRDRLESLVFLAKPATLHQPHKKTREPVRKRVPQQQDVIIENLVEQTKRRFTVHSCGNPTRTNFIQATKHGGHIRCRITCRCGWSCELISPSNIWKRSQRRFNRVSWTDGRSS